MTSAETGDTLLRLTIQIDLPPWLLFNMFWNTTEDSLTWKPMKAVKLVEQINDDEKVVKFQPDLSWAVQYLMGVPEWVTGRIVVRRNWPEENMYAFAIIPFDAEKNQPVDQIGPMKLQSGIIMPNPDDPNKCILTKLDRANLRYMPNFALKMLLQKKLVGGMNQMILDYKKSKTYEELQNA